jgi:hypothetical protein
LSFAPLFFSDGKRMLEALLKLGIAAEPAL